MELIERKDRYLKRLAALKKERSSWESHWKDLADFIEPRRSRFFSSDRNKGDKKNQNIVNNTATRARRILGSGMMAGITSPARPWFRLTTPDPKMAEVGSVRSWLHQVEERIRQSFMRSNIYRCLPLVYTDLAVFGTAAMHVDDDLEESLRGYVFPIGQYYLSNNARQAVDAIYREFSMTVGQLVERFGRNNCSSMVKTAHDRGEYEEWIEVVHLVEPNRDYAPNRIGLEGKRFSSCWFEKSSASGSPTFLKEHGYHEFPVMAPRWSATGEDVYGSSPGMEALGDVRALQLLEKRKSEVLDKIVRPPMRGPASMSTQTVSLQPGAMNYVDAVTQGQTFAPAIEVRADAMVAAEGSVREHVDRINASFMADLWLMMSESAGKQITAREVAERHEEKMLQLGPPLEQIEDELLELLIDRAFGIEYRLGNIPEPPPDLQGVEIRVEYMSIMAQAQKLVATAGIERLASFTGNLAAVKPDILDKLNFDEVIDEYASALGVKPDLVRTDEEVAEIRAARAQQQQQQAQMEQAGQLAAGAKVLSETDTTGSTALTQLMGSLGGPASVQ